MDWNINIKDIVTLRIHADSLMQFIFESLIVLVVCFSINTRLHTGMDILSVCLPPLINRKRVLDSLQQINKVL